MVAKVQTIKVPCEMPLADFNIMASWISPSSTSMEQTLWSTWCCGTALSVLVLGRLCNIASCMLTPRTLRLNHPLLPCCRSQCMKCHFRKRTPLIFVMTTTPSLRTFTKSASFLKKDENLLTVVISCSKEDFACETGFLESVYLGSQFPFFRERSTVWGDPKQ